MKKFVAPVLILALIAGAMVAPAEAAKKKKKKPPPPVEAPQPVATTGYLEGSTPIGEAEGLVYLSLQKDPGSSEKSMQLVNYGGGPNSNCAGNALFPVFTGPFAGKVTGDIKVTFDVAASGGAVDVRVWPDIAAQVCNETYPVPARSAEVALPAGSGSVEVVLSGEEFDVAGTLMIQVTPVLAGPFVGRIFYGTDASKVELSCFPTEGATSCIP